MILLLHMAWTKVNQGRADTRWGHLGELRWDHSQSGTTAGMAVRLGSAGTVTPMPTHSLSSMMVSGYLEFLHGGSGL